MHGKGACMQERQPLKRAVRILLQCILVFVTEVSERENTIQTGG